MMIKIVKATILIYVAYIGIGSLIDTPSAQETTDIQSENTASKQGLSEALSQAYRNNPTLQAARAELRAVQEQLPQAYSGYKPTVQADGSITVADTAGSNFGGADGATSKDFSVSLNQPLFRGGQTLSDVKAAKAVIQSQIAALRNVEQDILLASATAFMDVLRDQALLKLSQNNRKVIARQSEATRDRFDVGELTRTDNAQAEARLARADSDIITARGNLRSVEAVFGQIIGSSPENLEKPKSSFLKDNALPGSLDEAIKQAEVSSPLVLTTIFSHKAAQADVNGIFGELLPEIALNAQWNRTRDPQPGIIPEQTTRTVGVTASVPLYQAGATRSRVREAKYTENQRFMQVTEAKRQIRQEVITAWENLETAKAEIVTRKVEVSAARIAREGVNAEAEFGSRTILDALDSDQELLDAQVALVTAQRDKVVAEFTLMSILGHMAPDTLGFDNANFRYKGNGENPFKFDLFDLGVDRIGDTP